MKFEEIYQRMDNQQAKINDNDPFHLISTINNFLEKTEKAEYVYHKAKIRYNLNSYKLAGLTPEKVCSGYASIVSKFYNNNSEQNQTHWFDNELRIFVWILIAYSHIMDRSIQRMSSQDWKILSEIFNKKDVRLIQFQAQLVCQRQYRNKKWTEEEKKLLNSIIGPFHQQKKWKQIAQLLFYSSSRKFFRTPKQCRQQWLNYLDPNKLKAPWTKIEDYILLNGVFCQGKKWARISKILKNKRTQHMVKNRYNSLIKFQKRQNSDEHYLLKYALRKLKSEIGQNLASLQEHFLSQKSGEYPKIQAQSSFNQCHAVMPTKQPKNLDFESITSKLSFSMNQDFPYHSFKPMDEIILIDQGQIFQNQDKQLFEMLIGDSSAPF